MKISLWSVGKAHDPQLKEAILDFTKRAARYFPVEWHLFPPLKNAASLPEAELKRKEGEVLLQALKPEDYLVALDERGKMLTSPGLSKLLQERASGGTRSLVFLIGGAYGIDEKVLKAARVQWSLSALTFPHQLVRLVLAEQIYRACTILQNEKYHHS